MQRAIVLALLFDLSVRSLGSECAPGYKLKAKLAGLTCNTAATDAKSCNGNCCELDDKKCGGLTGIVCATGYFAGAADTTQVAKDAWKNQPATDKTKKTDCCTAQATCGGGGYTAPAGKKLTSGQEGTKCATGPASCPNVAGCFEKDKAKCGGQSTTVDQAKCDGWYADKDTYVEDTNSWKNSAAGSNGKPCCSAKATCASKFYSCPDGKKKKKGATDLCAGGAAKCAALAGCCVADNSKCSGFTVACPASKFQPTTQFWKDKPATNINKNENCCMVKSTCVMGLCDAGYKKKAGVEKLSCPSDAASCAETTAACCEKDTTKCGGQNGITCATGFYDESTTWDAKTKKAIKDAWKNKPATPLTKSTACCTPKAVCSAPFTTTPAATATPAATTTPAAPALKFSEHKVAVEEGSGSNMVWLGVGGLVGLSVLMGVKGLRSRMQQASAEVDVTQTRAEDAKLLDSTIE